MSTLPDVRPPSGMTDAEPAVLNDLGERLRKVIGRLHDAVASTTARAYVVAVGLKVRWGRAALFSVTVLALLPLALTAGVVHHVYFDRSALPSLDAFLRFEPPTTARSATREATC